jgi:AmpE protein
VANAGMPASWGQLRLYLLLAVPVLLVLALLLLLHACNWHFVAHGLSLLVLFYSFGSRLKGEDLRAYITDLERQDLQAAFHDAQAFTAQESGADNWQQLHQQTLQAVAVRNFERYFPVIFWFVVLGAPGALFCRLLALAEHKAPDADVPRLGRMRQTLAWLPLRLLGATLALVGNWQATIQVWLQSLLAFTLPVADVLVRYINAAIHGEKAFETDTPEQEIAEFEALADLMDRALVTWIAMIGIIAII